MTTIKYHTNNIHKHKQKCLKSTVRKRQNLLYNSQVFIQVADKRLKEYRRLEHNNKNGLIKMITTCH